MRDGRRRHAPSLLVAAAVLAIRRRRAAWQGYRLAPTHPDSIEALAAEFGLSKSMVSKVATGAVYKHVPEGLRA